MGGGRERERSQEKRKTENIYLYMCIIYIYIYTLINKPQFPLLCSIQGFTFFIWISRNNFKKLFFLFKQALTHVTHDRTSSSKMLVTQRPIFWGFTLDVPLLSDQFETSVTVPRWQTLEWWRWKSQKRKAVACIQSWDQVPVILLQSLASKSVCAHSQRDYLLCLSLIPFRPCFEGREESCWQEYLNGRIPERGQVLCSQLGSWSIPYIKRHCGHWQLSLRLPLLSLGRGLVLKTAQGRRLCGRSKEQRTHNHCDNLP